MDKTVKIPLIGSIYHIPELNRMNGYEKDNKDISWEIVSTRTGQDERGKFYTICTVVAIDREAEQIETIDAQRVNLDIHDNLEV